MTYAHTLANHPESDWETLEVHTANVARLAEKFAAAFNAGKWEKLLGQWHDLGKRSHEFQAYIRKTGDPDASEDEYSPGRIDHSTFGAQHAAKTVGGHIGQLLAFCIAGRLEACLTRQATMNRRADRPYRRGSSLRLLASPQWERPKNLRRQN